MKIYFYNVWFLWALCLVLNIITFLLIFSKTHAGAKTLALRYNVLVGVLWYGNGKNLYLIPGAAFFISLANLLLYRRLRGNTYFLSELTVFVSLCVQVILLSAALFLVNFN